MGTEVPLEKMKNFRKWMVAVAAEQVKLLNNNTK